MLDAIHRARLRLTANLKIVAIDRSTQYYSPYSPPSFEISNLYSKCSLAERISLVASMAPVPADEMDGKCS
jgi:hypothetical protein